MNFENFISQEYKIYKTTTNDPMDFDDWFKGCSYLENLYKELGGEL